MFAFEVFVNGTRLCTAGTSPDGVLSTIVSWTYRQPENLVFHVGGIRAGKHLQWNTPKVGVGDELLIRIIDSDAFDEPDNVYEPGQPRQAIMSEADAAELDRLADMMAQVDALLPKVSPLRESLQRLHSRYNLHLTRVGDATSRSRTPVSARH